MDAAQSTKQASKSSKCQRVAITVTIRETSKRLRLSSEPEDTVSTPIINEQDVSPTNVDVPKKKRGPTQVKAVPENMNYKMELEFNEFGQVIGTNSDKFASMAAAIVREYVPVVFKDL
ncbi:uncharacterized protein LOC111387500 isoform X1 [Olea europaea var. sylvestris]|uniref:uncharacterized protein LOC111387500 isoform X1 n=1 Tax=Olea europaea var. sylvestris TaxID=158386 RepID=UPI000C1D6453|nr:uncharacterized protein LOC111387500 isoform X1 [Olea europaea var. sylvestris]XP_022867835.1 uncharacterized protein LOC111387500 isoform X1 [Olea europaea var. sylvestris]